MLSFLHRSLIALSFTVIGIYMPLTAMAAEGAEGAGKIGVVLMHGKGGSPSKQVLPLATALERQGFLVANLEMPWSGRREYDVSVSTADAEVDAALRSLRDKGAGKLFIAGHSQGGLFALHCAGRHAIDGAIAIAPGGNVGNPVFREKLGRHVETARKLIAEGKGEAKLVLADYEGTKDTYPVTAVPSAYLSWFDPEGAMNQSAVLRGINPAVPVLLIVPTNDYPALLKIKQQVFEALPKNPLSKLVEPNSSHLNAPSASAEEIVAWTTAVANAK
ncbi:MAG: alpha/beta fold hydrolase [Pseudomonadota bacterium]